MTLIDMKRPISQIMQRIVCPISMDDTVADVEAVLKTHRISSVPVYDNGGTILGIITTTDLVNFHAGGKDALSTKAWEVCSYRPLEVTPDTAIVEVAEMMYTHKVHHVVVMENERIMGIASTFDFLKLFLAKKDT